MPAFEFKDDNKMPICHKHIDCYTIFDNKHVDLVRKARVVLVGYQIDIPSESTYSSMVSRDSVCIAFLVALLHELEVLLADAQNACLNASTKEKV